MKFRRAFLLLLIASAAAGQQPQRAKLLGFHDSRGITTRCSSQSDNDATEGSSTSTSCASSTVRVYTLEVGSARYEVRADDPKLGIPYASLFAKRGPLYGQAIGSTWDITMDGNNHIRVLTGKGKGYRYFIVAAAPE